MTPRKEPAFSPYPKKPVGICSECGGPVICIVPSRLIAGPTSILRSPDHYACESCSATAALFELPLPVIHTYLPDRKS